MSMATASILKKIIGTELAGSRHAKGVWTLEHGNDKRYLLPKHRVDLIEEGLYLFWLKSQKYLQRTYPLI